MTEQVKVVSDGTPKGTKVWVGGEELKNVRAVNININALDYGEVILTLQGVSVELDGRVNLEMDYPSDPLLDVTYVGGFETPTYSDPSQLLPDSAYHDDRDIVSDKD